MLLLEKMPSGDSREEAAEWGSIVVEESQSEKFVSSWNTVLIKQGLALLSGCLWYLNLCGLAKYI